MTAYLEHANVTVADIDATIEFLKAIEPGFTVRRDETPQGSYRWVHIGSDTCYIALQQPHLDSKPDRALQSYVNFGVNHLAWVVSDLNAVIARLRAKGYRKGIEAPRESHRKRAYYHDTAGFEWELVEYLSDKPEQRDLYE